MKKLFLCLSMTLATMCILPKKTMAQTDTSYSFSALDNPPMYPGGMNSFYKLISENLRYPNEAIRTKAQGKVFVSFIVEKDGELNEFKIERSITPSLDKEAIRVLKLSKKWNPGIQNGQPVRVKFNMPISFHLPNK